MCVVVPASLARHFDDVDLRYFYFSQSSFASLNLAQPPDTVDISHYTGLQHCLNLPQREPENSQQYFEHILCHMCQLVQSEGGNRASTAGTTRVANHHHHQKSALCHTQRTPSPSGSHQMTLRSWVPGRTNSFPNKSVQFSAQQYNPPSLKGEFRALFL